MTDQINAFHKALHAITHQAPHATTDLIAAQAKLGEILAWLWDVAAEPVLHALGFLEPPPDGTAWPQMWWAPGGLLALLPLHAAGYNTNPPDPRHRAVMDRVISSYTPTISALRHARQHAAARPAIPDQALIVSMPTTPGLRDEGRLPNVTNEAKLLKARLPRRVLLTEPDPASADLPDEREVPTRANVRHHLPGCTIAHFSCHGYADPKDPSRSRLLLHDHDDNPFNVADLATITLDHARLGYLSACSTAVTTTTGLLDEAIHLASAFQLAGFPHVIGTLWEITDDTAVTIADAFYSGLSTSSGTLDTSHAAHALHHAVRAVRVELPDDPFFWAAYMHAGA